MQNVNFSFSLISDIIVVLLLILFAFLGRRRGLVKMVSGVLVLVLAMTAAGMLSKWTTPYISSAFVEPKVEELLMPEFETPQAENTPDTQEDDISSSLLLKIGLSSSESLETAIADIKQSAAESVQGAVSSLSSSVSVKATYTISFIIYFIICLLIFSLLARVLNFAAKLPVINFFNRTGGFIIGAVWGYLVILVAASLLMKFKILITPEICEQTVVLNFILTKNPLSLLPIWN